MPEGMMHDDPRSRCWLEVDTQALTHNLSLAQERLSAGARLIAVLKADAYGLGLAPVARLFWEHGVRHFAVACLSEAFALRQALPEAWILCLGETLPGALPRAVAQGIRLTVGALDGARRASEAALEAGCEAYLHIKVDTGLHRIGFAASEAAEGIARCADLPSLALEGLYTHLALRNPASDQEQHDALMTVREEAARRGVRFRMTHLLDSIGLARYPAWQYDAVRVGALLYGNAPRGNEALAARVRPTVRFAARVARVFTVKAGGYIGYDDEEALTRDTRVAAITAGYADGYPRVFSHGGQVRIRGGLARILGLICMDQMMADVTDIPGVCQGDEATLLGDGISLTDYAARGHLNRNECTAIIGKRVPRLYL